MERACRNRFRLGRLWAAGAIFAAIALSWPAARADRVETQSGRVITGKVIEDSADKVVVRTDAETVTVPRNQVKSVDRTPDAPDPGRAAALPVAARDATAAFNDAAIAGNGGNWTRAAGLLEGLLNLDDAALAPDKRLQTVQALAVCYFQLKSPSGAAQALAKAVELTPGEKEKKRVGATIEAMRAAKGVAICKGAAPTRYEEALEAGAQWKAEQILAACKDTASRARYMNKMASLDRIVGALQDKLKDADAYVPDFYTQHRKDALAALVANMMEGGRNTVKTCTELREELQKGRLVSVTKVQYAKMWNENAAKYLETLDAAEDTLKNIKPMTDRYEVPDLYNDAEVKQILLQIDGLRSFKDGKKVDIRKYQAR